MKILVACMCALWLSAGAEVRAQQRVSGTWLVEFDMRIEREGDGAERVTERGKARLQLSQRGDSLFGTWQAMTGANRAARAVTGTVEGTKLRFTTGPSEATVNRNGEESKVQIVSEFSGTVDGDGVAGAMTVRPVNGAGMPAGGTRKWDGRRETSP